MLLQEFLEKYDATPEQRAALEYMLTTWDTRARLHPTMKATSNRRLVRAMKWAMSEQCQETVEELRREFCHRAATTLRCMLKLPKDAVGDLEALIPVGGCAFSKP